MLRLKHGIETNRQTDSMAKYASIESKFPKKRDFKLKKDSSLNSCDNMYVCSKKYHRDLF